MTPIPAEDLPVIKQSSQYRVLVQIELEKYLGSFQSFRFGKNKRIHGNMLSRPARSFLLPGPRPYSGKFVPALDKNVTSGTLPLAIKEHLNFPYDSGLNVT